MKQTLTNVMAIQKHVPKVQNEIRGFYHIIEKNKSETNLQVHPACPVSDLFFICESLYSRKLFPSNGSPRRSFENRLPQLARRRLKVPHFENILDVVFVLLPGLVGWSPPSFAPTERQVEILLRASLFLTNGCYRSNHHTLLLLRLLYARLFVCVHAKRV